MNHCGHHDCKLYQQACLVVVSSLSPMRLRTTLQPLTGAGSLSTRHFSSDRTYSKERLVCQQSTLRTTLNETLSPCVLSGVLCSCVLCGLGSCTWCKTSKALSRDVGDKA